jgi:NAD(P)H-nitrite reductase large subunit
MRTIIVGGGIAGTTAAEELRTRDPEHEITIIAAEQHPCYSRVLLPHYVKGKVAREKVFLKTPQWYFDKNIEFMNGVRVEKIDVRNKFVLTSEGRELPYDQLLLTTGTEISLLNDDRRGVSYLSTVEDADQLIALLSELKTLPKEEQKGFVYGSGFIACEYANIFAHYGIPFAMAMRGTGFWGRTLSRASQQVLLDQAKKQGVEVYTDEPTIEMLGDEELMGVRLKDGKDIPVKLLGIGIGVRANEHAVLEAAIPCADGILANAWLETAEKDVYTAGDAAEFQDETVGRRVRYGNWMNALMQGRHVAKSILGEKAPFTLVSSYATNLLGLHVVFIGDVSREHADEVQQTVIGEGISEEVFLRQGKCVGAVLIGDVKNRANLTKQIGQTYGT